MKATRKRVNGVQTKALYDLGLAIHWLAPGSKRPIESKWTTGARKSWPDLEASYRRGMNVGVRLGSASKIGDRFLAVIDCDVKSEDPDHLFELEEKLEEFFKGVAPVVKSGRGNGSRHVYILTSQPAKAQRLAQSSEKVKVFMPSAVQPSRYERANLSEEELKNGIRLRAAWEISLMGEGQQVVLPPSIHPDSGLEYAWETPLTSIDQIPSRDFETGGGGKDSLVLAGEGQFRPVAFDLVSSPLPDAMVDAIVSGEGVSDRSGALLWVANRMVKVGMTDDEILTVLTDPENFLGETAYDHAQTRDRSRAADWVRRYTLSKAKRDTAAEYAFDAEVEETLLSDEAADAQFKEVVEVKDWRDQIERGKEESGAKPKNTLKNVILILQGEGGKDVFKRNEFANADVYGRQAPWGSRPGAEVVDDDIIRIKTWLADSYRFEPSNDRINEAVSAVADQNRFHPVREYLDALEWDGVPRLDSWLKRYLNAEAPEPYLSAISRKVVCAMVARIYTPGCKFDQILILEGKQGVGKSTAIRMLAGDQWFTDATINVADKDSVMTMRSIWVIEQGELSSLRKADVDQFKEFVSRTTDRIRVPYGKRTENFPRQCIFIGTTNSKEYLKDATGNRRFWPVEVGACDFKAVARDRDQLLAEARLAYELGEPLYLETAEMVDVAVSEQSAREVLDPWTDVLGDWLAREDADDGALPRIDRACFRTEDLFEIGGPLVDKGKLNAPDVGRVGSILRSFGYKRSFLWDGSAKRSRRFWVSEAKT